MNDRTFSAFGDEVTKIAFFQKLRNGFVNTLREGWQGPTGNANTWMGRGPDIQPGMGRVGRTMEHFTGLGGLTKALPVGAKSMMLLGTAAMANQAMKRQDPSGMERSRPERLGAVAGNTVGGLMGAALAARYAPKSTMLAPLLGSIGGGMVGERVMTSPFRAAREHRAQQQQMPQQPQPYPPSEGAY